MSSSTPTLPMLQAENAELRARLEEMEETLRAIRTGEVDALVVESAGGPQVFVLQSSDADANRFRSDILAKVSEAIVALDEDRHVVFLNAAAERQYEVTASEVLGHPLSELYVNRWFAPEDEARALAAMHETGHWRGKSSHVKRSGEVIHVETSVSRMFAADGTPSGLLGVIRDITEQMRGEEARRQNEALFSRIIEQAPGGVYVIDDEFRVREVNSRSRAVFANVEPVIGRNLGEVMHAIWGPEVGPDLVAIFRRTLETGEPYVAPPFTAPRNDLGVVQSYEWEIRRLTLPNGRHGVVCYFTDTTERRQAEKALRRSQQTLTEQAEELRRADRNKNEFLAMLAHELRNPLAPLRNAAELLQMETTSAEERTESQRIIARQIENMGRMIDDLLDVSRITEGKIVLRQETVSLQAVLQAAASLARPLCAAHRQEFAVALPAGPIFLHGDATRLEQIFGNLLGNACKYSGEGSHISLSAEEKRTVEPPEVLVRVRDDGAGIDREVLPRIFDLFVQASRTLDRAHGGLGIGLTLVQRLVRLHGGGIEARSAGLGQGAEFLVRLPILRTAPAPAVAATPAAREKPRRILIVDDNADSARSMALLQARRGHETRTAFSGPEALTAAAEFLPEVVLLDIGLPGMDGFEVARQIRTQPALAGAFLIAMTGYASPEDRAESRAAGFDEHLVKPVDLERLRELLGRKRGEL